MILFTKIYDGESLYDVSRDVHEALDPRFNFEVKQIPADQYGIQKGSFRITIEWTPEEAA